MKGEYDFIKPSELRSLVAQSQVDGRCSERLGDFLVRIHDIVVKMTEKFRAEQPDVMQEAKSYSLYRWLKKGLWTIDLEKYQNPFSYIYSGSFLNMLHSVQRHYRDRKNYEEYAKALKEALKEQLPSFQVKDLDHLYD